MRQRHLGDFAREIGAIARPIAKRRAEAVSRQIAAAHAPQQHQHRHVRQRPAGVVAGENKIAIAALLHFLDDRQRGPRQRHPMLFGSLHPLCRNRPDPLVRELLPPRAEDFVGATCRQDGEFKGAGCNTLLLSEFGYERADLAVRQGGMMFATAL
jgi:hypothetical protein